MPTGLPTEFASLDVLMAQLPHLVANASPRAVADAVLALPAGMESLVGALEGVQAQAVYRDMAILVSAYIIESKFKKEEVRNTVPSVLAVPFAALAGKLKQEMIMSYDSYCLSNVYNTREEGKSRCAAGVSSEDGMMYGGRQWEDLRLSRAFDGGPEEATFVLIHAEIESHTPRLIRAFDAIVAALAEPAAVREAPLLAALGALKGTLERIVVSQLKMFNASDPRNYERFVRPWIFGWKGNADFPDGVSFEGVPAAQNTRLRGETGAQSTIIPSCDLVLGISHKQDALQSMLEELEAFRPQAQRAYLAKLRGTFYGEGVGVGGGLDGGSPHLLRDAVAAHASLPLARELNDCIGLVWAFRDVHVTFADMYISRFTSNANATGGTPFKAYLRKHRDESMAGQLRLEALGEAALCDWKLRPAEEVEADISASLEDATENGIPAFLLARHAPLIAAYPSPSLARKAYPRAGEISAWSTR